MFSWASFWSNASPENNADGHVPDMPGCFPQDSQDRNSQAHDGICELPGSLPPFAPRPTLSKPFDPEVGLGENHLPAVSAPVMRPEQSREMQESKVQESETRGPIENKAKPTVYRSSAPNSLTQHTSKKTSRSQKTPKSARSSSPASNEAVIALFGMTGTGKTSFINTLTGADMKIGHHLHSMTSEIEQVSCKIGDITVTLVDTPGFDDTSRTDTEILTLIASWLKAAYNENTKLTGLIYLHRISDNRMSGSSYRNLSMFRSLCGMQILSHVILATTMWNKVTEAEGSTRERDLLAEATFWGDMKQSGALVRRYDGSQTNALALVNELLEKTPITLKIQHEMVVEKKELIDTAAGKSVSARLEKMAADHKAELEMVKKDFENALKEKDAKLSEELILVRRGLESKIAENKRNMEMLKCPINTKSWYQLNYRCKNCHKKVWKWSRQKVLTAQCWHCDFRQTFV
ncbi:hypothetical protein PRK78_005441 [Emydomyces testavorans]|uniref:G domain-containing protein n=1 Tax=Emydomyces testavorans TaxID=2070801 RepID=A0AAF0DKJ8_9EURO|nr:hypothetical protein PRK78_005441 [Emydomyces testavorans]